MSQSVAFLVIHFLKNERKSSSDEQTDNSNTQEEVGIELQAGLHSEIHVSCRHLPPWKGLAIEIQQQNTCLAWSSTHPRKDT